MISADSRQFVEQRLRLFQIGGVEPLGEPAVNRREEIAGFGAPARLAPHPGEARCRAQFPELGLLFLGDAQGFAIQLPISPAPPPTADLAGDPGLSRCRLAIKQSGRVA
jgi:hypothetical protein